MKRFALLILSALLFAGCNNMLTNPDAFNVEEARVSMDISQLKARAAGDGEIITSTLEFVGTEPKHAPFEKTQTINGSTVNYTIKGIPVGSSVQVKLSVFKNGILVFEGLSDKITIKGKNALSIDLKKQKNWIILPASFKGENDTHFEKIYKIDLNSSGIDENSCKENNELLNPYTVYCTDDKDNIYYTVSNDNQAHDIFRLAPPYTNPVKVITTGSVIQTMKYDSATDTLYYLSMADKLCPVPNASTSTNLYINEDSEAIVHPYGLDNKFQIYNGNLYYIGSPSGANGAAIFRQPLGKSTTDKYLPLYAYDPYANDGNNYYGEIVQPLQSAIIFDDFNVGVSDLVATKEGIFVLIKDYVQSIKPGNYNATRGGIIKIDHNLSSAKLYGWTDTKHVIDINRFAYGESYNISQYMPKEITAGFYGPTKIIAVKPKKLYFTDYGAWGYIDENGDLPKKVQKSQKLVVFDLEDCTWTSQQIDLNLSGYFPGTNYSEFTYQQSICEITETWE